MRRSRTEDPAKFAHGLIRRIIEHGLERGWWSAGSYLGDPFGGVALGGIVAGYYGLNWVGVELESAATGGSPFVELGNRNIDLHRAKWKALGYDVDVRLVQGDSREFVTILRRLAIIDQLEQAKGSPEQMAGIVTSPPFQQSGVIDHEGQTNALIGKFKGGGASFLENYDYGSTPGQIGRLKAGNLDAAITSPPYAESLNAGGPVGESVKRARVGRKQVETHYSLDPAPGNIGALRAGQIEACVTSPPWENNSEGVMRADKFNNPEAYAEQMMHAGHGCSYEAAIRKMEKQKDAAHYGQSDGQIGNSTGQTYWEAMKTVYEQMYLALKPQGVAAIVVKDYIKGGKRVPLCDDTLKLLVSIGFEPIERVHAMLVKETVENTLFDGPVTRRREKKSFFRRLAERRGSPRIDFEEVLWVRKPA